VKLLILGGTRFLGRHIAEQALAAGHQVTLLHRGRSGAALFPQAEHRIADRNGDLAALGSSAQDGTWDACIDTNAYVPRHVRAVAAKLAGRVGQYQVVSSVSVYADEGIEGCDESGALARLADPTVETVTGETYGGLKVLCEEAAREAFGERCLVSRPGLIVGPHDPSGRFTWWVRRFARGGAVLAPGDPATPVQFIDARDAAAWSLLQAERGTAGTFNLVGPTEALSIGGLLEAAQATLNPKATLRWIDEAWLLEQGVQPWSDLPVWLPRAQAGMHRTDIRRALATGLQTRPLAQTLADTATWAAGQPDHPGVGLAPEREAALLAAWAARCTS
jgi:2'-hydroxyisoflavone reductase